ncbi:MAG: NAD(P)H-hydrate dehydratase [Bacteroides sp.]|nr:NAD(P)H-hydrate dehydratase [Bacteroides sp.]MBD5369404.1 NAD(P)H-hydrate dehydratase [Bacteroides sp.]
MKIFSSENIRNIDRATIQEGTSAMELIHRVAEGVVKEIVQRFGTSKPIVVFAGPGNNGADALIVAKLLIEAGYSPEIYLFNIKGNSLSRDCREAYGELMTLPSVKMTEIIDTARIPELSPAHLVVDGLFGTGLRDSLEGGFKMLARYISEKGATVYSIDIPSGLFCDWNQGNLSRDMVHATMTFAVQYPRLSFFLRDNADIVGQWKLLDIGLSKTAAAATPTKYYYVECAEVADVLKHRKPFSSKSDFGTALIYSGCYGMMGAAVMAARGALRAGVGKLTVHSGRCGFDILQSQVPEALFEPDPKDILISDMSPRHNYDAICAGPGIGVNDATRGALKSLIMNVRNPLVLDADALNIIAKEPSLLNHLAPGTILTPHAGEFDRIFGQHTSAEARLIRATEVSHKYKVNIVMKGHYTAVVRHDGNVFFNSTGSPAMATPGSGDVLAGVITALLAQGYKPGTAAVAGVYIHGLAGEMAAEIHGEYGTTAIDIAENVGRAIASILKTKK